MGGQETGWEEARRGALSNWQGSRGTLGERLRGAVKQGWELGGAVGVGVKGWRWDRLGVRLGAPM